MRMKVNLLLFKEKKIIILDRVVLISKIIVELKKTEMKKIRLRLDLKKSIKIKIKIKIKIRFPIKIIISKNTNKCL
jgi:hypothetical protein